ncbi:TetR/AcrR family transcriptional regulator [Haloechinothrix alba]|nr:TetR/AcrR family transcriptional regulator [Haloechinothrix alba]
MTTRMYGGKTARERQSERRAALLDAALDVLAEHGATGVTMRAVCHRARLNDRYFYEHFRDRDALLKAVLDDVTAAGIQHVLGAVARAETDIPTVMRAAIAAGLEFVTEDRRRGTLLVESQATDALRAGRNEVIRSLARTMTTQSRALLGERAPSESDAELAALTLASGVLEVVAMWLRDRLDTSREQLTDVLAGMLVTSVDLPRAISRSADGASRADPTE